MAYLIDLANLSKLVRAGDGTATAQALIAIAERLERLVELNQEHKCPACGSTLIPSRK